MAWVLVCDDDQRREFYPHRFTSKASADVAAEALEWSGAFDEVFVASEAEIKRKRIAETDDEE